MKRQLLASILAMALAAQLGAGVFASEQKSISNPAPTVSEVETQENSSVSMSIVSDDDMADDETVLLGINGTYYTESKNTILDRINEIRYEACEEGVINPDTGDALTLDDYVPIKWSSDLEEIARLRSAEATVNTSHTRPNGSNCFTCESSNGETSWAEDLAWNWSGLMEGIEQWYEEKSDWVNQDSTAVTGHFTSLIDPTYLYIGIGTFRQAAGGWYAVAAELSFQTGLDETKSSQSGRCIQPIEVMTDAVTDLTIQGETSLQEGEDETLAVEAEVAFDGDTSTGTVTSDLKWTSSDGQVASVSENGLVKALSIGKTTIKAASGNRNAKLDLTVDHCFTSEVTKEPTVTEEGIRTYTCTVCGAVKTETIDKKVLETPKLTSVVNASTGVAIKWDAVNGAEKYRIFRKISGGGWTKIGDTATTSFTDKKVKSGTSYTYTVRCITADAEAYTSSYDKTGKTITYLAQPTSLKAASACYNSVKVSWGKVNGADGYRIYRKTSDGWKKLKDITTTSYTDTGLTAGTNYTYTVKAYKGSTWSAYDKTGASAKPVTAAPALNSITRNGTNVTIKWSKVSGASGYRIYRKVPGGSWTKIADVGSSTTRYTNKSLKPGKYTYTVRAYRTVAGTKVLGNYNTDGLTMSLSPSTPKLTSATAATGSITIKWGKVSNADGYRVYRKSSGGEWKTIATLSKNATVSYKDTTPQKGTTYYYTVRAYTKTGNTNVWSSYDKTGIKAKAK